MILQMKQKTKFWKIGTCTFNRIHTWKQSIFSSLSRKRISVFDGMNVYPIDWYQNDIPSAMPLHDWKKF